MALNAAVLGALLVAQVGPTDPLGIAGYMAMGAPIVTWTIANLVAVPTMGLPLTAAGPAITGTGGFTVGSAVPLKTALASAIGISDTPGLNKLDIVVQHYADTIANYGQINTALLVAYAGPAPPPTGPVTGTGAILLSHDFDFVTALGITDIPGIAKWTAFGNALKTHLQTASVIAPTMTNPAAGGPVTGTGAVS